MHTFCENVKLVEAIAPQAGGSELTGDWINLENCNHLAVEAHIKQDNAATIALTIEQAKDVSGTDAKAITEAVPIFANQDCAAGDTLTRQTDAVSFTTSATLKNKIVVFEIDPATLDKANGFKCLRIKAGASDAANIVSARYLATGLRYGEKSMITD